MSVGRRSSAVALARLNVLVAVLSVPAFTGVWELVARSGIVNAVLFPPPSTVAVAILEWIRSGQFLADLMASLSRVAAGPAAIPCPDSGRPLRIATIEANAYAICPACATHGQGGFVSFVGDLRMAYACPQCRDFVWLAGV